MSTERYRDLVTELCIRFHIDIPTDTLEEGFSLKVNQTLFTLQCDLEADEDELLIFCEFSEYPSENIPLALKRLMKVNVLSYLKNGPKFSLNPDTGHIILFSRASLSELSPDILVLILLNLSNCARLWQKYALLEDETITPKVSNAVSQTANERMLGPLLKSSLFPGITVQLVLEQEDCLSMSADSLASINSVLNDEISTEASSEIYNALFELERDGLFMWSSLNKKQTGNP